MGKTEEVSGDAIRDLLSASDEARDDDWCLEVENRPRVFAVLAGFVRIGKLGF